MVRPTSNAVIGRHLVKRFGDFEAVRGVDFEVSERECFGFLGPNGFVLPLNLLHRRLVK